MNEYVWETAEETDLQVAKRIGRLRKRRGISGIRPLQQQHGVFIAAVFFCLCRVFRRFRRSFGSVKRFERTGQISLLSLTKIATALGCADEIRHLFEAVPYGSIEEVIRERK